MDIWKLHSYFIKRRIINIKIENGVFLNNFVRININDGVSGQIIINRISEDNVIDLNSHQLIINDASEAKEVIKLIEDAIDYLNGRYWTEMYFDHNLRKE